MLQRGRIGRPHHGKALAALLLLSSLLLVRWHRNVSLVQGTLVRSRITVLKTRLRRENLLRELWLHVSIAMAPAHLPLLIIVNLRRR